MAEQLAVPLRGSAFGQQFAKALYQAGEGAEHPQPSLRMLDNSSWAPLKL